MRQCHFCERYFKNKQAVRAHLRFCPHYRGEAPARARPMRYQCEACGKQEPERTGFCRRCGNSTWIDLHG